MAGVALVQAGAGLFEGLGLDGGGVVAQIDEPHPPRVTRTPLHDA